MGGDCFVSCLALSIKCLNFLKQSVDAEALTTVLTITYLHLSERQCKK